MADPYVYPNGTLRNKLGIRDPAMLHRVERGLTNTRLIEVSEAGPAGPFDMERLRATHAFLFQDVYGWAGELRTTPLGLPDAERGRVYWFPDPEESALILEELFEDLQGERELKGLPREAFADRAAQYFARLNYAHPFRDGNGRTQRAFFEALAEEAGHDLAFDVVSRERMAEASARAHGGNEAAFERLFREIADPGRVGHLRAAIAFMERHDYDWNERYLAATVPGRRYEGQLVAIGAESFMMHDGRNSILVGRTADLGAGSRAPGDAVSFVTPEVGGGRSASGGWEL